MKSSLRRTDWRQFLSTELPISKCISCFNHSKLLKVDILDLKKRGPICVDKSNNVYLLLLYGVTSIFFLFVVSFFVVVVVVFLN